MDDIPFATPNSLIEINSSSGSLVLESSTFRTLKLSNNNYDKNWLSRQKLSLQEYEITQVESDIDALTECTYTLFSDFLELEMLWQVD